MERSKVKGRRSIYLRESKDKDLIMYIASLIEKHDFSDIVRGLMRDGIEFRESRSREVEREHTVVLQSNQTTHKPNQDILEDIKITKKEVDEEEIRERMDGFLEAL